MLRQIHAFAIAALCATTAAAQQADAPQDDLNRTPFGDWTRVCSADNATCALEQAGKTEAGETALLFSVAKLPEPREVNGQRAEAALTVQTPLGVLLTSGVGVKVDSGEAVRFNYVTCLQEFCVVQAPMTDTLLASFRAGARALVAFNIVQNNQAREVVTTVSLSGFTRGYNGL